MSELLLHYIVPLSILLICGLTLKRSLVLACFGIVPDLDVFFHAHRTVTHSAIIILLVCIPIIIFISRKYPNSLNNALIATGVLISHVFMDLFTGCTPIFYPIHNKYIWLVFELTTNLDSLSILTLTFDINFTPDVFYAPYGMNAPVFTSQGFAISVLILIGITIKYFLKKKINKKYTRR